MTTILLTILLGALGSMLASEVTDISQAITRVLLAGAARRLPEDHRNRYIDEWNGDLDYLRTTRGKLAILFWAIGVYLSSYRLAAAIEDTTPARDISHITSEDVPTVPPAASTPLALFANFDTFDEYFLQISASPQIHALILRALRQIQLAPEMNPTVAVEGIRFYVHSLAPCTVGAEQLPGLFIAYMYSREDNVVRPLFVCKTGDVISDSADTTEPAVLSRLRAIVQLAVRRLSRYHEH